MKLFYDIGISTTEYALKNENVQNFIKNTENNFDLVVCEQFYQEPFLLLAHKYQAPIVTIGTLGYEAYMNDIMGGFTPWAHVPHEYLNFDDSMSFGQRIQNAYAFMYEKYSRNNKYLPRMNQLSKTYLYHIVENDLPKIEEMEKNISIMLINTHVALSTPQPLVPAIIPIGGAHIKPIKMLVTDLRKFLDDSIHGAIYFSLGTNLRSSDLPDDKLQAILNTFSKIKQKVLWKFENDRIPNLPANVMIKKWMPQNDILGHPHVRAFITHGGLLSTQEAVFRGVPMIGIPIYGHQHINIKKSVKSGYAIELKFSNITNTSLLWAIDEIMHNPVYAEKMSYTSKLFRDRPIRALDEAIYWIEYVIKYNGASHLRSFALNLSWPSYFLLDIIATFTLIALSIIILFLCIIIFIMKRKRMSKSAKKML